MRKKIQKRNLKRKQVRQMLQKPKESGKVNLYDDYIKGIIWRYLK